VLAVLRVFEDRLDDAIALLDREVRGSSATPCGLSDLSAVLLARATRRGDAHDHVLALGAAARAVAASPALPEARFNFALVADRLGLPNTALTAWSAYLQLEPEGGWAEEGRRLLAVWENDHPNAAGNARRRAEAALLSWAAHVLSPAPTDAGVDLVNATVAAVTLQGLTADSLLAQSAAALREPGGDAARRKLAEAFGAFSEGRARFARDDFAAARERFEAALATFRETGFPFQAVVAVEAARCDYYLGDLDGAVARFAPIDSRLLQASGSVRGHVGRIRGLIRFERGDFVGALADYERAVDDLDGAGEKEWAIHARYLVAEDLRMLGQGRAAWPWRVAAFHDIRRLGDPGVRPAVFADAGTAAAEEGSLDAALVMIDEFVAAAQKGGDPALKVTAHQQRAKLRGAAGRTEAALDDLTTARRLIADVRDADLRRRLEADTAMATAEVLVSVRPDDARIAADQAITYFSAPDHALFLSQALHLRARAAMSQGHAGAAGRDLQRTVEVIETQGKGVVSPALRAEYLDRASRVFETLVDLLLRDGRARAALDYLDRSRSPWSTRTSAIPHRDGGHRAEPTVLTYGILGPRVWVWMTHGNKTRAAALSASSAEISQQLDDLSGLVRARSAAPAIKSALQALFQALIEPVRGYLPPPGAELVIVPHGPLFHVPWAALVDGADGKYLVERLTIRVAARHGDGVAARPGLRARASGDLHAVVVGDPAFSRTTFPWLSRLPGADREARAVAEIYPGARLLTGPEATRGALLGSLSGASILHFAGHALEAERSGRSALLLAPSADASADGAALYGGDLEALDLSDVGLVVLSSCRGQAGPISNAGGTASLARSLLAAGASGVLAGLWDANDETTVELMVGFHRRLRAGMSPATALRDAQLAMLRTTESDLSSPLAWAGFQVIEDTAGAGR
jgi:CHAT domain-containing protein